MPQFLDLPRELRDMIYMAVLTLERPRPTIEGVQWSVELAQRDVGYAYAQEPPPSTCANFLQCNRQIHDELMEMICFAKERGLMNVKLDCMARFDVISFFTWLRIPVVKTTVKARETVQTRRSSWASMVWEKCRICAPKTVGACLNCQDVSTLIHQLWIDLRIMDGYGEFFDAEAEISQTAWAICDVLKHLLEIGPDYLTAEQPSRVTTIDELVLNVVPPPGIPEGEYLQEGGGVREFVDSRKLARDLVDMWKKIWAAEQEGRRYQLLLQRITRVRVCVNDKTYRVRELRLELERGQAEQKRIAARLGYYRA